MKKFLFNFFVYLFCLFIYYNLELKIFSSIFTAEHLIFPYAIHPFDICSLYPQTWNFIKKSYCIVSLVSYTIIHFYIILILSKYLPKMNLSINKKVKPNKNLDVDNSTAITLKIGISNTKTPIYISEKGLYQNILITGTIGSGKTSSAMYPFTKQLIAFEASNSKRKLGLLILDVKRKLC